MTTTKLSSKGQVIIPKIVRSRHNWHIGQELSIIDTGDGVLLRPSRLFRETKLEEVGGCLKRSGNTVSLEEMDAAIKKGALERKQ